ncbi:transposase [Hydrogenibacillus schlegelii]|uniref:transposase n=1 Tax=Hydrogenibacillus schlegelii TaxID=1484 RepID=UPI0034A08E6E
MRRALKRLRRLQRKLSRRGVWDEKGRLIERTKIYEKTRLEIDRLHRRIRNIRLDFLHKLTTELVRLHPVIAIEDLNVAGCRKTTALPGPSPTSAGVPFGHFSKRKPSFGE